MAAGMPVPILYARSNTKGLTLNRGNRIGYMGAPLLKEDAKMGRCCGLLLRILMIVLLTPFAAAFGAERPAVTAVRVADHDGVTRFVMELSAAAQFQVEAQSDPRRIIVDFSDLGWSAGIRSLARPVGLVRNFRFEEPGGEAGRLVLETRHPATVNKAFLIPPAAGGNFRLVVDVGVMATATPPGAASPRTAAQASAPQGTTSQGSTSQGSTSQGAVSPGAASPAGAGQQGSAVVPTSAPVPPASPAAAQPSHREGQGAKGTGRVPPAAPKAPPAPAQAQAAIPSAAALAVPGGAERKASRVGKPVVVIDPGHGGVDPGATSITGAYEKNIVLALARAVKAQLDKDGKVKCVLTRDRDVFIPLRERVAIARAANADLFLSLHADTVTDGDIRGLSVYTLSQTASDAEAQALADKENKADIVAGIDLSNESPEVTNILIDLVQRESMNLSAVFAHRLIREVSRETRQLLQNTHRFAGFAVLKAPDVPSVLVETGYLSNPKDEQMLRRPEYRAKLAGAMARAIEQYFVQTRKARRT